MAVTMDGLCMGMAVNPINDLLTRLSITGPSSVGSIQKGKEIVEEHENSSTQPGKKIALAQGKKPKWKCLARKGALGHMEAVGGIVLGKRLSGHDMESEQMSGKKVEPGPARQFN
ncbi:hypothetical protein ACOSQ3_018817 [Xanthoceras sorbifolium]